MDFGRVLVTDRLAWEIFGAAALEKLLFLGDPLEPPPQKRAGFAGQRALSLIVLFDRLLIHEFGGGTFRLPDLEKEGIVEIIPADQPRVGAQPLPTAWRKGRLSSRGRPPKTLLRSLSLVQQFRPLVTNRLLTGRNGFVSVLSKALGLSRRRLIDTFLDYAIAYIQGRDSFVRGHVFNEALPTDLVNEITEELFDFTAKGERLSPTNALLVFAIAFAEEIAIIRER